MKFSCPKCEQNLEVGEDLAGSTFPCPSCGENIHLEAEADSTSEDYLDFNCAHCDGKIRSTKEMEGSEVDCPHCQASTILQLNIENEKDNLLPPVINKKKNSFSILSLIGITISAISVLALIAFYLLDDLDINESLQNINESLQEEEISRFQFGESVDPLHKTKSYWFHILEKPPKEGDLPSQIRQLHIYYGTEHGTQIIFTPKQVEFLDHDLSSTASVSIRIDEEAIRTSDWRKSTQFGRNIVLYPNDLKKLFIKELLQAKELVIRINQKSQSDITAVFDLTGFDEAFEPMKPILGI